MKKLSARALLCSPPQAIILSLLIVVAVGLVDFLSGYEISFSIFYLLAISCALWNVGTAFAVFIAMLSLASWLVGDWAAGAKYPNTFVPVWNAFIIFCSYLLVIWLLTRLKSFNQSLEAGIRERTAALAAESREREWLEKEILTISEREQQRIGHELHDSLCQHLTATALASQVLEEKLEEQSSPLVQDSKTIINLIEEGIAIARNLARGLFPVEIEAEGLLSALHELAERNSIRQGTICRFDTEHTVLIHDAFVAGHLYRIAQEAVGNAVRYSGAAEIVLSLAETEDGVKLAIRDNGRGIPHLPQKRKGMGLHIMRHRATMIGGRFEIHSDSSGTTITCAVDIRHGNRTSSPHETQRLSR